MMKCKKAILNRDNRELFRLFKMSVLPIIPNNHDTRSDG